MRINTSAAGAAGPMLLPRRMVRAGRPGPTPDAEATLVSALRSNLPSPVADRLATFMASDPELAQAVNAQLPGARQASARDLAAYVATARPPLVDVNG
jgi:hypothetical protein